MRLAVISDVHANFPALEAVLAEIAREPVDRLVCLGDLVGYNADPGACIDAMHAAGAMMVGGNHERAVAGLDPIAGTNMAARRVFAWTRAHLDEDDLRFLEALPAIVCDEAAGFAAVHGCFLHPEVYPHGYVTPPMLEPNLRALAASIGVRVGLHGHTHVPAVAWLAPGGCEERRCPEHVRWPCDATAVLINPGAVGQPRDGDWRAAWALVDLEARTAEIRRVAYDVGRTVRAVISAGLPAELAQRLFSGR